ncbi:amino acid/amide ABC transporter membrane protein 2, HAAT family (TC 3.A.1.4.-)/amino acid/amide ABC transporter ATP-binding protein 1, HAAT family (TC 3.A.1.4.-) [Geodermatophilus africanus]|uniref:Amino acid/amide ABC transporter membrane protein 2, HAAT family (TC 3.A.1.4.-)/amino acid/amide ABC transporter ATP-binding protein 1, HAAT family (TC 3.A.1.4.-) n=1 Tax=Geodermatophilus africanus TaxID=1137993 RepID=A0A1H3NY58_9ACTN|nr:branched-chain amino acid ABC transporter ATP-binding protein/permease [Geodermatophilus africanus]SDY93741.1 amino acid/amide ABC transporter membrane protein 2, HAAT family (TC 3.A.1.4.-)/amino acid/amide ABC transporter ATP-binding protein 1, HAAT family (TC 3.A.1.4.-) [Geodermatophilus africanus]
MLAQYATTLTFIALGAIFAYSFYAVLIAGQLSLGQAGFASLAAFSAASLAPSGDDVGDVPALLAAVVIGMAVGALAAVVLGLPTMHLRGVFLAIATLGFAEAVRVVLLNQEWTGGAQGLAVPRILTVGTAWTVLAVVAYWFWRMGRSRYGRALEAIREDELAARSMGIDVGRHRLAAFITAGAVAGLYGVLFAYYVRLIAPNDFDFTAAVEGLVTAVVGGSTMFVGPVLGSGFQTMVPEIQRAVGVEAGWIRPFLAGLLLLVVILFLPGGLASLIPRRTRVPSMSGADPVPGLAARRHPAAGETVVSLTGLAKEYGGVHAVRGIDLEIRSGEVVGLIGPNGAGKTTLVNMISGLVPPSSGSATVLGTTIGRTPVHRVAAAGVSRTFQHSKLFNRLSALENVLVGAHLVSRPTFLRRLLWLPSARRDERAALVHAARCLERVGLSDLAGNRASSLSYGDQRRLEIARALASEPSLLILDEPAAGMNHVEAARLSELIRSLARDGLTILFIEHNVGMVLETCTRVVVLDFGEVIASGSPAEIAADPAVIEAYLGTADDEADGRSIADGTLTDPTGAGGAVAAPGAVTNVDPSAAGTLDLPDTTPRNAT